MKILKLKTKVRNSYLLCFFTFSILIFQFAIAEAATLYFDPSSLKLGVGEAARVDFVLDSPENVNAIEGAISFPSDVVAVKDVSDGNSIISIWIARPAVANGKISFAGAIPGGYPAFAGKVFSVEFLAKKTGRVSLDIANAQALLNDGQGTPALLSLKSLPVTIVSKPTGVGLPKVEDKAPPESFKPLITADPNLFDGKYFLVFAAQDKGAGIDYYEVSETRGFWPFKPRPENWERSESSHPLKDQELKSWVFVKVVDKQGNERIEVLSPANVLVYQKLLTIIIGIILVMLLLVVWRRLKKRSRS